MKGTSSVPGKPSFSFYFLIFSAYSGLISQRSAVVNKDVLTHCPKFSFSEEQKRRFKALISEESPCQF